MAELTKKGALSFIKEMALLIIIVFIIRTFGFGLYQVPTGSMETTILVGERFFADKFTILFSPPKRGDIIAFNEPATKFQYSSNPLVYLFQQYVWGPNNLTKRVIGVPGDKVKGVVEDGKPVIYINDKKLDEPYLNSLPILPVWDGDPKKLIAATENEVMQGIERGYIDPTRAQDAMNCMLSRHVIHRSYDPSKSYNDQVFYRINPERIVQGAEILKPGTPDMRVEKKPEMPNQNYWGENADEFYIELGPNQYWVMGDNRKGSGDSRTFGPIDGKFIHGKIIFRIWSIDSDESWWIVDLLKHPIDFWTRIRWKRFFQIVR